MAGHMVIKQTFHRQIAIAYIIAIPITYWLMLHWCEQFVYRAPLSITDFLLPLLLVWGISVLTVFLQSYILNRTSPIDAIKTE